MIPKSSWGRICTVWQAHLSFQTVYLGQIVSGLPLPHNLHFSVSKNSSSTISPQSALWETERRTYTQNRNIHILQAVAPEEKEGGGIRKRFQSELKGAGGVMALYTGLMQARKVHCFRLGPSLQYLHRKRQLCCEAQERKWTNLFPLRASQSGGARPQGTVTSCW